MLSLRSNNGKHSFRNVEIVLTGLLIVNDEMLITTDLKKSVVYPGFKQTPLLAYYSF
jgi:hypothetical protein